MENGTHDELQKLLVTMEAETGKVEVMKNAFDKVLEPVLGMIKNLIGKAQNRPIAESKGDISKIPDIETTNKVVTVLLKSSNAKVKNAAQDLKQLHDNIKNRKTSFLKAYNMRMAVSGSLAYAVYVTSVECYVRGVSMLIGYQTEQFKKDTFVLAKVKKYNEYYKRGMVDKFLTLALDKQKATVKEGGFIIEGEELKAVKESPEAFVLTGLAIGAILTFAFFLRVLVFYFYWSRTEISEYFAEQATFLNIHEAEIKKNGNLSKEEKDSIINAQRKWSSALMTASDFFAVEDIKAAQKAATSVKAANKTISPETINADNTGMDFF
jgi:hypothetical protein